MDVMNREFSTFDLVKILDCKRNTLQTALAAGFIVPDIHRAQGPAERSRFSLNGVYRAALFFQLVKIGIPRKAAASVVNVDLGWEDWNDLGDGPGQTPFIEVIKNRADQGGLHVPGGSCSKVKIPSTPEAGEIFRWMIAVAPIKRIVEEGLKKV